MKAILLLLSSLVIGLASSQLAAAEIQFYAQLYGRTPTNGAHGTVRYGRASLTLTGDVLSIEVRMPAAYPPVYCNIIDIGGDMQGAFTVVEFRSVSCVPEGTNMPPMDGINLELLPGCVFRESFRVPESRVASLFGGQWILIASRAGGQILPVDSDGDGVPDFRDACPNTQGGALINADGCSIEQLCPCAGPWKNHGEYVNCMKRVTANFLDAGLITEAQRRALHSQAAQSNCGKR